MPRTCEEERVDVLPVVAAGHVLLPETDGVLALGHAVKLLQLLLGDALGARTEQSQAQRG